MISRTSFVAAGGAALTLALALTGCAPATPNVPGSPTAAAGTWGSDAAGSPQLVLAEDGSLTGTDGCNRLMGRWIEEGPVIVFEEVASTMMYCEDVDTWLADLSTGSVRGSTLRILDADGVEIGSLARG